ncbi:hypothetical protein D3C85_854250 [compost metagenome]
MDAETTVIGNAVAELAYPVTLGSAVVEQLDQAAQGGRDGVGLHTVSTENAAAFIGCPHGRRHTLDEVPGDSFESGVGVQSAWIGWRSDAFFEFLQILAAQTLLHLANLGNSQSILISRGALGVLDDFEGQSVAFGLAVTGAGQGQLKQRGGHAVRVVQVRGVNARLCQVGGSCYGALTGQYLRGSNVLSNSAHGIAHDQRQAGDRVGLGWRLGWQLIGHAPLDDGFLHFGQ